MKENKLPLKNYNIFALQGDNETTDMDVVETLGLDPDVAYTPTINDAAIRKMYNDNMEQYMAQGMSKDEAEKLARFHADAATAAVKAAMRADQKNDF
jgi:hypothetical protein